MFDGDQLRFGQGNLKKGELRFWLDLNWTSMLSQNSKPIVRSNNCLSSGLKSRPGNYPCAPVAQGSGVLATEGRKFPIGKAADRNASKPTSSLVIEIGDADPVIGRGRPSRMCLLNEIGTCDLPG